MGTTFTMIYQHLTEKSEKIVSVTGLTGAGKTTLLYKLDKAFEFACPTNEIQSEHSCYNHFLLKAVDIPVNGKTSSCFDKSSGIIFMIDAHNRDMLFDADKEFKQILCNYRQKKNSNSSVC